MSLRARVARLEEKLSLGDVETLHALRLLFAGERPELDGAPRRMRRAVDAMRRALELRVFDGVVPTQELQLAAEQVAGHDASESAEAVPAEGANAGEG